MGRGGEGGWLGIVRGKGRGWLGIEGVGEGLVGDREGEGFLLYMAYRKHWLPYKKERFLYSNN
jgi:hypothetical protein